MQRIDDRIAIAGLFGVALTHWKGDFYYAQAFVMGVFALVALAFMVKDWTVRAIAVYAAGWLAYLLWASMTGRIGEEATPQAIIAMQLLTMSAIIYVVARMGRTSVNGWLNAICILAAGISAFGLVQYYATGVASSTLGNQNFLGAFLAMAGICCLRKKWWMLLPLVIGCLYATKTATAIAAFLIGAGYLAWRWKGVGAAVIAGAAYCSFFKGMESLFVRIDFWADAMEKISHKWNTVVFGVGPGIFWRPIGNTLHSEYVNLVFSLGVLGLALVGFYVWLSFRNVQDKTLFACLLAILVDGSGNMLFHTAVPCYTAIVLLALNDRGRKDWRALKPPLGYHPVYSPRPWWWIAGYFIRKAAWRAEIALPKTREIPV